MRSIWAEPTALDERAPKRSPPDGGTTLSAPSRVRLEANSDEVLSPLPTRIIHELMQAAMVFVSRHLSVSNTPGVLLEEIAHLDEPTFERTKVYAFLARLDAKAQRK